MSSRRWYGIVVVAALLTAVSGLARAEMVPFGDTVLVFGSQVDVFDIDIGQPGDFEVSIFDLDIPQPLADVDISVYQASTLIAASAENFSGSMTLAFFASGAGKAFVMVRSRAITATSFGLYSINIVPSAPFVALPASFYLLATGLGLLFPVLRRRLPSSHRPHVVQPA